MENHTMASARSDIHQKAWKYVYSMNAEYHDNLTLMALEDGNGSYSYKKCSVCGSDMLLYSRHSK